MKTELSLKKKNYILRQERKQYFYWLKCVDNTEICLSSLCTIGRKWNSEVFIKSKDLDNFKCCKLARVYFLEDDISQLWNKVQGTS